MASLCAVMDFSNCFMHTSCVNKCVYKMPKHNCQKLNTQSTLHLISVHKCIFFSPSQGPTYAKSLVPTLILTFDDLGRLTVKEVAVFNRQIVCGGDCTKESHIISKTHTYICMHVNAHKVIMEWLQWMFLVEFCLGQGPLRKPFKPL